MDEVCIESCLRRHLDGTREDRQACRQDCINSRYNAKKSKQNGVIYSSKKFKQESGDPRDVCFDLCHKEYPYSWENEERQVCTDVCETVTEILTDKDEDKIPFTARLLQSSSKISKTATVLLIVLIVLIVIITVYLASR